MAETLGLEIKELQLQLYPEYNHKESFEIKYTKEPFEILNGHPFSALLVSSMRRSMFN
jgi:hypothetical protein